MRRRSASLARLPARIITPDSREWNSFSREEDSRATLPETFIPSTRRKKRNKYRARWYFAPRNFTAREEGAKQLLRHKFNALYNRLFLSITVIHKSPQTCRLAKFTAWLRQFDTFYDIYILQFNAKVSPVKIIATHLREATYREAINRQIV